MNETLDSVSSIPGIDKRKRNTGNILEQLQEKYPDMADGGTVELEAIDTKVPDDTKSSSSTCATESNEELWNIFRKDRYEDETQCCAGFTEKFFKGLKLLTYIFLFVVVSASVITSRGSLQILVNIYGNEDKKHSNRTITQDFIAYLLLLLISLPDALTFLQSILKFLFGKREKPTLAALFTVVIRESLHLFALSALVYKVLPYLNPVETCAITTSIPLIPAFVNTVAYCRKRQRVGWTKRKSLKQFFNALSFLLLLALIVAVPVFINFDNNELQKRQELLAWMIPSLILLSTRWIETYASRNVGLILISASLQKGHVILYCVSSLIRLLLIIFLVPVVFCPGIREITNTYDTFSSLSSQQLSHNTTVNCSMNSSNTTSVVIDNSCSEEIVQFWTVMGLFLVHGIGTMVGNHCAIVACKLCMQIVGFSIPLAMSAPIYIITLIVLHETGIDFIQTHIGNLDTGSDRYEIILGLFFVGWLAQLWICRHIWAPSGDERLAFTRRLFSLPQYCSPLMDLSLLHCRKRKKTAFLSQEEKLANNIPPKVYVCATMWHENRAEMKQILTTLFRLDFDQCKRALSKECGKETEDYYEFEAHILFDDAMETTKTNRREPNDFVRQFMQIIEDSGFSVYKTSVNLNPPKKICTPYGGRLEWKLPGGNKLVVHLKDKDKIRHKKRWSQIMYMYYFIGYELMERNRSSIIKEGIPDFQSYPTLFAKDALPPEILEKAASSYILALDGDVDFQPEALQLLIDRMKKNPQVGATCGRIKPGGSGPVFWYQRFEYAIGHWLQKSAEHIFGCVLCSPGCFSMFRIKSLMDDNVMRTYATLPTEPRHFLQYDQGEDRWLCTLLLQQGYRIEYCAAAEAFTFAPEEFKEFFNQRRRWLPSTMANILDLLQSYSRTTRKNPSISYFYIFYQIILFFSSVLGPSTVLLAMESAVDSVFDIPTWLAYLLTYGPTIAFVFICLKCKTNTQLNVAMVLSAIYALLMMAVIVGTLVSIASEGWYTPTGMFLYVLVGSFLIAGFLHPHEFGDLVCGVMYFICIPAGYLFLIIYAICNLNNVSWGTRETQKAVLEDELGEIQKKSKKKETEDELENVTTEMIDSMLRQVKDTNITNASCKDSLFSVFRWLNNLVILKALESVQHIFEKSRDENTKSADMRDASKSFYNRKRNKANSQTSTEFDDKSWAKDDIKGTAHFLSSTETRFWENLIRHYLYPLEADKKKEKEDADALADFRNKVAFGFFFVNALWLAIMTAMNEVKHIVHLNIPQGNGPPITVEPLGFIFLILFTLLLLMQFVGMIMHRYGTLLHIIAATKLREVKTDDVKEKIGKLVLDNDSDYIEYPVYDDTKINEKDVSLAYKRTRIRRFENSGYKKHKLPGKREQLDVRKTFKRTVYLQIAAGNQDRGKTNTSMRL